MLRRVVMKTKLAVIVVLVGVLVAALVVWLAAQPPSTPRSEAAPAQIREPAPKEVETPATVPPPSPPAPQKTTEISPGSIRVVGTISYEDTQRSPNTFEASFWPEEREQEPIRFRAPQGRFEIELPAAGRYTLMYVVADGVKHDYYQKGFLFTQHTEITVQLALAREVTLVVVHDGSGNPISGARVYEHRGSHDWESFETPHQIPGPRTIAQEPLRTDSSGCFRLGRGFGVKQFYIVADGCAWTSAAIPFAMGGEVRVRLVAGGGVRLRIPQWRELEQPLLWAHCDHRSLHLRVRPPNEVGGGLVHGLPVGNYVFEIRRGGWWEDSHVYGRATVEVVAGVVVPLTIEVNPGQALGKAVVTGTLTVPRGWTDRPAWVTFEGLETENAEINETVHFRGWQDRETLPFRTDPIPAGRYLVEAASLGWGQKIEVPIGGGHFDLSLPPPLDLHVRVIDDTTGHDIPTAQLNWNAVHERLGGWATYSVPRDHATGVFKLQVPPAVLALSAEADGYIDRGLKVGVEAGKLCEAVIRLQRAAVLTVRLRLDGESFSGDGVAVEVERSWAGGSYCSARGFDNGEARFADLAPGTWTVDVSESPILEEVEPLRIELKAGETKQIVIDLRRKR
jgi:hypothetical protein